jgi:hypothetical protein
MMQVVKDKLNITDPKKIKTLETILYGRDATHKDEGVYGNIVKANGLEWDYDNWCPQGSTSKIEHDTEGTISIKSVVKETTDDETLAAMSTKSKPKKKKVEINTDGDDFFS